MASGKGPDEGVVSRLAGRGEDALTRLMDELGRKSLVTDALARAMSAKGRLDNASRSALAGVGLAAADELDDLRKQVADLERRLATLEGSGKSGSSRSGRSSTTSTKKTSTSRSKSGSRSGTSGAKSPSGSGRSDSKSSRSTPSG